ncbi:Vacuolar ATP synthase subunit C [Coemansia sp. RSA 2706]|nr:Vacuolar ATP synthase subunit C [Coemansia sp. RSA 2711]KAJ2297548.1 Vacuolar ATP synthase subunit C [Coemansia sp. RSA 2706]KAJ2304201.1 Vacuolar ATP synthase subunit C [Coemansia sp. RSA 2705]KAJ2312556.1 Vacuolar ATP synthase subunit C [Coemansia sp. RSA 2704]KAJ2393015.1 Vacuolar ATP synthase subunit C [Coemansia sp. RSA 2611]KAJ2720482.1 Vacuolar ATP synthase subunit C [Coemansia sp. Cherry 401B]
MTLYWLLSVPAHGDGHVAWRDVKSRVADSELYDFLLPQFKIGTLDTLVQLSDELSKYDTAYENTTAKFIDTLRSLTQANNAALQSMLTVDDKPVDQYIRTFSWNNSKFRSDRALPEILAQIAEAMGAIDAQLKSKLTQYNAIKNSLATVRRKQTGNLSVKSLNGIVKRDDCVPGSDYLQTLFVAVPRNLTKEWRNSYERLTDMVVPRSSAKLAEDSEYALYSVVVFKRVIDEFSNKARDARFIVRDFVYDEDAMQRDRELATSVVEQEEELLDNISEWLKGTFGDVVSAWIHIKALRVFVESILRYGIPPDFLPVLVKPPAKQQAKIRQQLAEFYAYLETSSRASERAKLAGKARPHKASEDSAFDMHEFSNILSDYTPFVFFEIPWNFFNED